MVQGCASGWCREMVVGRKGGGSGWCRDVLVGGAERW